MTLDEAMDVAGIACLNQWTSPVQEAAITLAAGVRRLQSELEESDAVHDKCARLLAETAAALKGPEAALSRHSWHDLPEIAATMRAEVRRLQSPRSGVCQIGPPKQIAPTVWEDWGMTE